MTTTMRAALLTVMALACAAATADNRDRDRDHERRGKGRDCASLAGRSLGGATISTAVVVPASARQPTVLFGFGAQAVGTPVVASIAASRLRATPLMVVNNPPTYTMPLL